MAGGGNAGSGSNFGDCDGLEVGDADIGVAADPSGDPVVSLSGLAKLACKLGLASCRVPAAASVRASRNVVRSERVICDAVDTDVDGSRIADAWARAGEC